jgi:hypothetical protein
MPKKITTKKNNSKTRKNRRHSKTSKNKPKRSYSVSKKIYQVKKTKRKRIKTKTKRGGDDDDYDELRDPHARNHRLEQANKLNEEYYKEHGKWPWEN